MRKRRLFTPGPTPLSPRVQEALGRPILHHRTPEFAELLLETRRNLQKIFRTEYDLVILAASGTGAMEASVNNLLGGEGHALVVSAGKFGERWVQLCDAYGVKCDLLMKDYGQAASPEEIAGKLKENPGVEAVFLQGCETSTATAHDLSAIGRMIRREHQDVLLVVDGITTVACQRLETDAWGLDVVISGSQKAFAVPPGLSFLSISPRALRRMKAHSPAKFYLDLVKEAENQAQGKTSFTSSVSLTAALLESTRQILEEGLDQVVEETGRMARACRAGLEAMNFRLLSRSPANACTAAFPPRGVEAVALIRGLEANFGIKVAGGQGPLQGKILRIAHLGYFDILDVFAVLSAIEMMLIEMGREVDCGSAVGAAMREAATEREAV